MSEELDALRRRLYAPGVTAEEVERYHELAGEADPAPEADQQPADADPHVRRPARITGIGAAVVVVLAAVGATVLPRQPPAPNPTPSATVTPTAPTAAFDGSVLALPASTRTAFVDALRAGGSPEVLHYFYEHPGDLPAQVRTVSRASSDEHIGSGPGEVLLSPSPEAQRGGRLTVVVTVDRAARVELRAIRADSGMQSFFERLEDGARASAGLPMVRGIVYDGEAPTLLVLTVPAGVRWDVVTVFTD